MPDLAGQLPKRPCLLCLATVTLLWLEVILFPWFRICTWDKTEAFPIRGSGVPNLFIPQPACGRDIVRQLSFLDVFNRTYSLPPTWKGRMNNRLIRSADHGACGDVWLADRRCSDASNSRRLAIGIGAVARIWHPDYFTRRGATRFSLAPNHITRAKRDLLGWRPFLAISAALVGQLYVKHLAWRSLTHRCRLGLARL